MKKREANFELLRVIAMLMIITLHYLDKGGILPKADSDIGLTGFLAWGLEAFCVSSVNVYVLLGAYFLAKGQYRPTKAVALWLQVLFYSVGIAAVLIISGVIPLAEFDKYRLLIYLFPVIEEHYWFVTAYVLMILLAPLMNEGLRLLPKKTYRQGILLLLLLLSVSNSILPVQLPVDRMGYDALWFLCLYLLGAYFRYYGETDKLLKKLGSFQCALGGYVLFSLLIFASFLAVWTVYQKTGSLADFINRQYHYNSIFCLLAAICLFFAFRSVSIQEGKWAGMICKAASASFGVYLIHEHIDLRYLWNTWLGTARFAHTPLFLLHWLPCVLAVYAVCMLIDLSRQLVFAKLGIYWKNIHDRGITK